MIQGFEDITGHLSDEEKSLIHLVIKGLNAHKGEDRAIKTELICFKLCNKYKVKISPPRLRKIVNFIRSNSILPVVGTSKGYYVADNKEALKKQIDSLTERMDAIQAARDGLQTIWDNMNLDDRQLTLDI
jgi:hypothetical protein